jgi:hypothetical protein
VPQSKDLRLHLSLLSPVFSIKKNVISTEAVHSFIVGPVVEKSASPPHLFSVRNPHLLLLLPVFLHTIKKSQLDQSGSRSPRESRSGRIRCCTRTSPQPANPPFLVDRRIHSNERPPPGHP